MMRVETAICDTCERMRVCVVREGGSGVVSILLVYTLCQVSSHASCEDERLEAASRCGAALLYGFVHAKM